MYLPWTGDVPFVYPPYTCTGSRGHDACLRAAVNEVPGRLA